MPARTLNVESSTKKIKTRVNKAKTDLAAGERFMIRLKAKNKRNAAVVRRMNPLIDRTYKIRKSLRSKKIDVQKILEDLLEMIEIHGANIETLTKKITIQEERSIKLLQELGELKHGAFKQLKWYVIQSQKELEFNTINRVRFPGDDVIGGLLLEDEPFFSEK